MKFIHNSQKPEPCIDEATSIKIMNQASRINCPKPTCAPISPHFFKGPWLCCVECLGNGQKYIFLLYRNSFTITLVNEIEAIKDI